MIFKTSQKQLDRQKEYYKENRAYILARNRIYDLKNAQKLCLAKKDSRLMRRYGITLAEYTKMLEAQDYRCYICRDFETRLLRGKIRSLSVDHNHSTGKARSLLCYNCNTALGLVKENYKIASGLSLYVLRFNVINESLGKYQNIQHYIDPLSSGVINETN